MTDGHAVVRVDLQLANSQSAFVAMFLRLCEKEQVAIVYTGGVQVYLGPNWRCPLSSRPGHFNPQERTVVRIA
jgi:hypothetical protein